MIFVFAFILYGLLFCGVSARADMGPKPSIHLTVENAPQDFGESITVATNTQNRVEKKDFISPLQVLMKKAVTIIRASLQIPKRT